MNKYEIRREALQNLANRFGRGGRTHIAANIGKNINYVSRMLYPEGKPGFKRIGEDSVDALNKAFPGWITLETVSGPHVIRYETKDKMAHAWVQKAVKQGYLPRPTTLICLDCGAPAQVYDHRDYNRPLDVEPVCHACNVRRGPALPFVHVNDR